jgi:CheY-like chemotaxis protein
VRRCIRREPPAGLRQLPLAADPVPAPRLVPGDCDVDETLEEVALGRLSRAPHGFELLVGLEVAARADELEASRVLALTGQGGMFARVATILLVGVDLFFRGKLDVLLQGHHLVMTDTLADPELVIADISRVEPEEVADTYPDIPIVGFSSHTDTAGLRRANAAGFDQVLAKSALQERAAEVINELLAPVE